MNSKQRAYLMHMAATEPTIVYVGKAGVTPDLIFQVEEALTARELIKIGIQQNCPETGKEVAEKLTERAQAQLVQQIGRKIILFKPNSEKKKRIILP